MLITIFSIFIILIVFYELFRSSKNLTLLFFTIAPLACTLLWLTYDSLDWFKWVKAYSLAAIVIAITLTKYKRYSKSKKLFNLVYTFLGINILEAVIRDFSTLDFTSVINIFIGVFLIATLIDPNHDTHTDLDSNTKNLITPKLTKHWVLIYTLWNWVYVYNEYPEFALKHIAVLAVPFFIEFLNKGTWLQARTITLGFYVIFALTTNPYIDAYFPKLNPNYTFLPLFISIVNLAILICFVTLKGPKINFNAFYIFKKKALILANSIASLFKIH